MSLNYAVRILKNQRNKLEDILDEIAEGHYNRNSDEQVQAFKSRTIRDIESLHDAIKILYANED